MGENIPLAFELSYSNIDIIFGDSEEVDVIAEYTLLLRVKYDTTHPANKELKLDHTEILLDELKMMTSFSVEMEDDIVFAQIQTMQLSIHERYGVRD